MYNTNPYAQPQQYRAYANAAMTVGKLRQVVMLYDGAIRFTQQSVEAIAKKDYTARYNLLAKTTAIIAGLQTSIDHDSGGEIAQILHDFYSSLESRITAVHRSNDITVLEGVLKELRMMRDVWHEIDQASTPAKADQGVAIPSASAHIPHGSVGVSA